MLPNTTNSPPSNSRAWRWWRRPLAVEAANTRPDPVFPAPLVLVRQGDARTGNPTHQPRTLDPEDEGPPTPALPLALYDLGGDDPATRGRGAPIALRVFVEYPCWPCQPTRAPPTP